MIGSMWDNSTRYMKEHFYFNSISHTNHWSENSLKEVENKEKLRYKSIFHFPISWNGKCTASLRTFSEETIGSILLAHQVAGRRNPALCL